MLNIKPILLVNGILLSILAVVMFIPMFVDLAANNPDWKTFAASIFITGFTGGMLYLSNRGDHGNLSVKETFIFTSSSYFVVALFASLPLYMSTILDLHFIDAYFESVSGLTATGSTILTGLDDMPPGILLWRSLLNAMGGIGIVVMALAILPMLKIGGMQLFKTESSDTMDKMLPRATQIAAVISGVFFALMVACAILYWLAGMTGFDAICHSLATISTGGFSTHDKSIGYFDSVLIEFITMIFMIAGALPIMMYFQFLRGNKKAVMGNTQVKAFLRIALAVISILVIWLVTQKDMNVLTAIRYAAFSVLAVITTTGYASVDYGVWGGFATCLFFMLITVGGCTGSTSGGIKIFRFQVLYKTAWAQVSQLLQPNGVFVPQYNGKAISENVSNSVMGFIILFGFSFMIIALFLSFFGLDFLTSMSAAAQALANVGPGLGSMIGPSGNYADFPDGAKLLLTFAMIIGRLELFTVLVMLVPNFWRD